MRVYSTNCHIFMINFDIPINRRAYLSKFILLKPEMLQHLFTGAEFHIPGIYLLCAYYRFLGNI